MGLLRRLAGSQHGVTLIELLVVVVILGIIAAVAIPLVTSNQQDAYASTNRQNMQIINEALQRYAINNGGQYPGDLDELISDEKGGPYVTEIPPVYNSDGEIEDMNDYYNSQAGKVKIPEDYLGADEDGS